MQLYTLPLSVYKMLNCIVKFLREFPHILLSTVLSLFQKNLLPVVT